MGWWVLGFGLVVAVVLLAAAPYLGRALGRRRGTEEGLSPDGRRVVLLAVVLVGALGFGGYQELADRRLDARERALRQDLAAAGPERLERIRQAGDTALWPTGRDGLDDTPIGSITSAATFTSSVLPSRGEGRWVLRARIDWVASSRCFALVIEPGGAHSLRQRGC